jgi:predicted nucleotidyltransferase
MSADSFGISTKNLELILVTLKSFPEIKSAAIFGSRAMGNYKQGSDIDISIQGNITQALLAKIKAALEEEISTPYLFDVVNYAELQNENLKDHIDRYGITLYKIKEKI